MQADRRFDRMLALDKIQGVDHEVVTILIAFVRLLFTQDRHDAVRKSHNNAAHLRIQSARTYTCRKVCQAPRRRVAESHHIAEWQVCGRPPNARTAPSSRGSETMFISIIGVNAFRPS